MTVTTSGVHLLEELYSFIDKHIDQCVEEYLPAVVAPNGFVENKCMFTLGDIVLVVTFDGGKWFYEVGNIKISSEFGALFHNRILDRLKERKLEKTFEVWLTQSNKDLELKYFRLEDAISNLLTGKEVQIDI